jgi:arylsulfatase A
MKKVSILFLFFMVFVSKSVLGKPNIVYFLADEMGYGDLGCYGQEVLETPHIDHLVMEGTRLNYSNL